MLCATAFEVATNRVQNLKVLLSHDGGKPEDGLFLSFCNHDDAALVYCPYRDDFGPMNLSSTIRFIKLVDEMVLKCEQQGIGQLVYFAAEGRRALSNAVMLLGAYMILVLDKAPGQVAESFSWIGEERLEDFKDVSSPPADFGLTLLDCWSGLYRGKQLHWIARPSHLGSPFWGDIDIEQYEHYDHPLQADMVEVVPFKLIAFRGPKDLGGARYIDNDAQSTRRFGPEHFAGAFQDLDVSDVVRLNAPEYDAGVFGAAGIRHHDLYFEDCTVPPTDVVDAFMRIVDAATGVVAVHCLAGLGRTGTLIGLYMMRTHGFTAREAMGWLRIMRPGSVIGDQQQFLCTVERRFDVARQLPQALPEPSQGSTSASVSSSPPPPPQAAQEPDLSSARTSSLLDWLGLRRSASSPASLTDLPSDDLTVRGPQGAGTERSREQAAQVAAAMGPQSAARIRAGTSVAGRVRPSGSAGVA
jgi:cell division cycle 14